MTGSYYRRLDTHDYESTDFTRSNWSQEIQHGSPPLALLTKAVEELLEGSGLRIGRLGLDILGAIPVAPLRVRTSVPRPGKRISLVCAEMATTDQPDRAVARLTAWALATSDTEDIAVDRFPPLVEGPTQPPPSYWWNAPGYLESVEREPSPTIRPARTCAGCPHAWASSTMNRRPDCSGWQWSSIRPTALARRSIPTRSCS